jgi:hypothetical protein
MSQVVLGGTERAAAFVTLFLWGFSLPVLRIRNVYPGSSFLTIPDPGSNNSNKRDWVKISCPTFFCSHKYHKIDNYFIIEQAKKNI